MRGKKVTKGLNVRSRGYYVVCLGGAIQGTCDMSMLCIFWRTHILLCPLHVCRLQE